jgi:outer membrane protein assembly factor BamB
MKTSDHGGLFRSRSNEVIRGAITGLILLITCSSLRADWPMYRNDAARSGYTTQRLDAPLQEGWIYREPHAPHSAWPRSDRQTFDRAIQPVISDGTVYFGDTVTGVINALDLKTGTLKWRFFTEGPVRFAPVVFEDRLFVTSDDGCLYSLNLSSGQMLWKHQGGPDHSRRLGNERMISRWPARGGAVVVESIVYYGAGIWPSDGIFLHALDARSGEPIWVNDNSGSIHMPQPHGGADAESGVAAQGYLVATNTSPTETSGKNNPREWLLVPTGRAVPAAFDRATGQFQYFNLQKYGHKGSSSVVASNRYFLNSGMAFDTVTGESLETIGAGAVVSTADGVVKHSGNALEGSRWEIVEKKDRKGVPYQAPSLASLWSVNDVPVPQELIMANTTAVIGAEKKVLTVDSEKQSVTWQADIDGTAMGLAVSDGCLLVSTNTGTLYCFQPTTAAATAADTSEKQNTPIATNAESKTSDSPMPVVDIQLTAAAEQILTQSKMRAGYCLDLGCGDGQLAMALAQQSDLQIIAIESDPQLLQQARERLLAANLLGSRVTVLAAADLADTGLPNYFANLIVSQQALKDGVESLPLGELERLLRPYGGVWVIGAPDALIRHERGPLAGAGQWTHQYSTAGNSTCSTDELVKGPLGLLWFRDIELEMPQRHGRGPGPLFYDGRLYSMGLNELACVDAYNGRLLWKYPLPNILKAYDGDELMGTAGTHSNYCIADTGLYVRRESRCLRIDRVTGQLIEEFKAPLQPDGQPGTWGFIACQNGILIGTLADPEHVVTFRYVNRGGDMKSLLTESKTLFAMDATSGETLWRFDADASLRHNAIAFDGDGVYFIERPVARFDRVKNAKPDDHPTGSIVALDARTGKARWKSVNQIDGTLLALSEKHPVLLMGSQPTSFALASEPGNSVAVFDLKTGEQLWRKSAAYRSRPMINDRTIYAQGGAWDLLTGEEQPFSFSRSYGCGVLAGSKHTMVFRSATLGYFDFEHQEKTDNFGGIRPGCWINAIPAGGLVLVPDASAGCVCSYLNQSWFALEPDGLRPPAISPKGGAFREPVEVTLTPDEPGQTVRYTLDGTTPNAGSPEVHGAIRVDANISLKARTFDANNRPGRMAESEFVIDPTILPIEDAHWRVWDVSGAGVSSPPSRWAVKDGTISQLSNIFLGRATEANSEVERYGTMRIYQDAMPFADGQMELEMRSDDDDSLGIVFRCLDEKQHYLFSSDRQRNFSILAVKNGDEYRLLATSDRAYQPGKWHRLKVTMDGANLQIDLDEQRLLEASDSTFSTGTIGLHSWGSDKVQFRNIRLKAR